MIHFLIDLFVLIFSVFDLNFDLFYSDTWPLGFLKKFLFDFECKELSESLKVIESDESDESYEPDELLRNGDARGQRPFNERCLNLR